MLSAAEQSSFLTRSTGHRITNKNLNNLIRAE